MMNQEEKGSNMYYEYELENPRNWIKSAKVYPSVTATGGLRCYILNVLTDRGAYHDYFKSAENAKAAFSRDYLGGKQHGRNKWKKNNVS